MTPVAPPSPPPRESSTCAPSFIINGARRVVDYSAETGADSSKYITSDLRWRLLQLGLDGDDSAEGAPLELPPADSGPPDTWLKPFELGFTCSWIITSPQDANVTIVVE